MFAVRSLRPIPAHSRGLASPAAYAYNAAAKAPTKKLPLTAASKALHVSQMENGMQLVTADDKQSPVSSLALVLHAGPRYQQGHRQQGLAQWLKAYGFKSTNHRSSIRITREADIMGHVLSTALTRENIFFQVDFRRDDLPDAVDLLADVLDGYVRRDKEPWGIYTREFVRKTAEWKVAAAQVQEETAAAHASDPVTLVMDGLHRAAFRTGLGNPLYPSVSGIDVQDALAFATEHISPAKTALVGFGVDAADLASSAQHFFGGYKSDKAAASSATAAKYFGGEHFEEVVQGDEVVYAVAFPGAALSQSDYYTAQVLRQALGGNKCSAVKYGTCHSALGKLSPSVHADSFSLSYSDAGLFGFVLRGSNAGEVGQAAKQSVAALKELAGGQASAAVKNALEATKRALLEEVETAGRLEKIQALASQARFNKKLLSAAEITNTLSQVTEAKVSALATKMLKSKPSVSALGDVYALPHIEELGL